MLLDEYTILPIPLSPSPLPFLYLVPFSLSMLARGMTIHRLEAKNSFFQVQDHEAHFHVLIDGADGGNRFLRGLSTPECVRGVKGPTSLANPHLDP